MEKRRSAQEAREKRRALRKDKESREKEARDEEGKEKRMKKMGFIQSLVVEAREKRRALRKDKELREKEARKKKWALERRTARHAMSKRPIPLMTSPYPEYFHKSIKTAAEGLARRRLKRGMDIRDDHLAKMQRWARERVAWRENPHRNIALGTYRNVQYKMHHPGENSLARRNLKWYVEDVLCLLDDEDHREKLGAHECDEYRQKVCTLKEWIKNNKDPSQLDIELQKTQCEDQLRPIMEKFFGSTEHYVIAETARARIREQYESSEANYSSSETEIGEALEEILVRNLGARSEKCLMAYCRRGRHDAHTKTVKMFRNYGARALKRELEQLWGEDEFRAGRSKISCWDPQHISDGVKKGEAAVQEAVQKGLTRNSTTRLPAKEYFPPRANIYGEPYSPTCHSPGSSPRAPFPPSKTPYFRKKRKHSPPSPRYDSDWCSSMCSSDQSDSPPGPLDFFRGTHPPGWQEDR